MKKDKISCLCATYNRWERLKHTINCFLRQTYENKELIIVSEGSKAYKEKIANYVKSLDSSDIRMEFLEGNYTLGAIRNISMQLAKGTIVCQWDDDDLQHPKRLEIQYLDMVKKKAGISFFTDQLQFFWQDKELFWSDWVRDTESDLLQLIPGTLMMVKDDRFSYPEFGTEASAGEDSAFLEQIYHSGIPIARLSGYGFLYIYCFHESKQNVFSYDHHRALALQRSCSPEFLEEHRPELEQALKDYDLPRPFSFYVAIREKIFSLH